MKATEVLNRYANGERDFRRANLRGQSFKGQDLSGANFTNAVLKEADFMGAKAGVQRRWIVSQLLLLLVLSALAGVLQGFVGHYIAVYFPRWW